jgi:hypothetical protein
VTGLREVSDDVGRTAASMLAAAGTLSGSATVLGEEVARFLAGMRTGRAA